MQILALARQQGAVDRLGEERVAEAKAALIGDEDTVVDGAAKRLAHVALLQPRRGAQQRVANVAPGCGGQSQHALRPAIEPRYPSQQQVAQPAGGSPRASLAAARSSSVKNGLPSERATIASASAAGIAPARASISAASSAGASGPSSSMSAAPERSTLSASRRIRSADSGSSAR